MRTCPRCGKPEYASSQADFCFEANCFWKTQPAEGSEVQAEYISALDDAAIRQQCITLALQARGAGESFEELVMHAVVLYDWVMGKDELELEEAAEPASVTPEESCEPRPH